MTSDQEFLNMLREIENCLGHREKVEDNVFTKLKYILDNQRQIWDKLEDIERKLNSLT